MTLPAVGGASSIGGQKAIVVDTSNPTASVTTPAVDGNSYNAASLPANIAGSSADTGGSSTVSSVQVAIQDGAGNYWGGATFNQASIFYNATGGTVAAWTYGTGTLVGQLTNGHTYTITAQLHRPGRQHRHDDAHVRLRHHRADRHERHLDRSGRRLPVRHARSRSRSPSARTCIVTGSPTLALNSGGTASYSVRLGHLDPDLHLHDRRAATTAPTSTTRRRTRSRSRAARSRTPRPTTRRSRSRPSAAPRARRPEEHRRRHQQPDRVGHDAGDQRQHVQRSLAAREPGRLLGRHRRLQHRLERAGRDPGRRRQLLGRRDLQPGLDLLQRDRRHRRSLDLRDRHPRRAADDGHTYTITAKSTDPAGNTGTTTRTFVYDTTAPTVTNVSSTKADGAYPSGTLDPDHGHLQRERDRDGHAHAGAQFGRHRDLQLR